MPFRPAPTLFVSQFAAQAAFLAPVPVLPDIARDLGLKTVTLTRWLKESQGSTLRPVEILAAPRHAETSPLPRGVTMTLPNGIRIEGLGLESVVALLRQLG